MYILIQSRVNVIVILIALLLWTSLDQLLPVPIERDYHITCVDNDMPPERPTGPPLPQRRQPANLPPTIILNDKTLHIDRTFDQQNQQQQLPCAVYEPIYQRFKIPPTLLQTPGPGHRPTFSRIESGPPTPHPHINSMKTIVNDLVEMSSMEIPQSPQLMWYLEIASGEEWVMLLYYIYNLLIPLEATLHRLGHQLLIIGSALGYEEVLESVRKVLDQVYSHLPVKSDGHPVSFVWPSPPYGAGHDGITSNDNVRPPWLLGQVLEGVGLMRKKKEWETLCQGRLEVWRREAARRGIDVGD